MTTPSVTLKSLKNTDTGIDISIPRIQEEEAPLGGISILFEISVLTTLELFKTRLHRGEDVVHFSIFKAYREIEDLYNKLNKKYPKAGLPPVPKPSTADKFTNDEKLEALNVFMAAVAKNIEICHSSTFTQFIGINSQRLPSFNVPKTNSENSNINPSTYQDNQDNFNDKTSKKNLTKSIESKFEDSKKGFLFQEESSAVNKETASDKKCTSSEGLFDEFEDNLFKTKSTSKKQAGKQDIEKKPSLKEVKAISPKQKKPTPLAKPDVVDDSEIIITDRKVGEVSLFEEQDLGDYVTKEEEALFLVTAPNKSSTNFLLSKNNDILSPEKTDNFINENLDDLLDLEPLPILPVEKIKQDTISNQPQKPVPQPRKKSIGKVAPEVMPRRVFLGNKDGEPPQATKTPPPTIPAKPTLPTTPKPKGLLQTAKPKPPTKPKPPPRKPNPGSGGKTKVEDLDLKNANQPNANENSHNTVDTAGDLKELDILKYIEQEQKILDSNLGLFD